MSGILQTKAEAETKPFVSPFQLIANITAQGILDNM
jgi:hypothetical protein